MRRILSWALLIYVLTLTLMPLNVLAAGSGSPPEKPYEKMIVKKGNWYSSQFSYAGENSLVVGFRGSFEKTSSEIFFTFDVKETTILTGVYIPFKGLLTERVGMALVSDQGNFYQGFEGKIEYVGTVKEVQAPAPVEPDVDDYEYRLDDQKGNTVVYFQPEDAIVLPKGRYMIQLDGATAWPADGYFVKGMDYKAYEKYKAALLKWLGEDEKEVLGNEELGEDFWERVLDELTKDPLWMAEEAPYKAPVFELEDYYVIDEIILSTWNDGQGASPGLIYLYDGEGSLVDIYQSQGYSWGDEANTFWVALPDILLPPGIYYLDIDDQWALDFDEDGEPMFAISVSPAPDEPAVFTGTYRINLDLYKIKTLMGEVDPPEKAFDLRHHEIAVIDKGEFIEIIGKYEGIPFSQNCQLIERGDDYAIVSFDFGADLSGLPYKAKIAAQGEITFTMDANGRFSVNADGFGYYDRAASKDKGADSNTYNLTAKGNKVKNELPPFVMTAIGAAYGAGNIPGPDSPMEAAAGMLFPPLVGLVVASLQNALKPKELKPKLSVGEQAMKDANHSMAGKLVSEDEARAWATLADALGASGGDPDDPISIGDNERVAATGEGQTGGVFAGYDDDYGVDDTYSPSEDYKIGEDYATEPAPRVDEARPGEPLVEPGMEETETYESPTPYTIYGAPKTLTLVADHRGNVDTYVQNPKTGEYINERTGGVLDTEQHEKAMKPSMEANRIHDEKARRDNLEKSWLSRQVEEREAAERAAWAQEDHIRKMQDKYGLDDVGKIHEMIRERQETDMKIAETWTNVANRFETAEKVASVTVVIADTALDGLEQVTGPVGKGINIAYKGVKNVSSVMAEDGISWTSAARGAIKGGADIAGGFIDNPYYKAAVTIGAETAQAAMKDGMEGAAKGFVEGTINYGVGAAIDKFAGSGFGKEVSTFATGGGKVRVAINTGEKWVGRTVTKQVAETFVANKYDSLKKNVAVKLAGGLINEFGIKPTISDPVVDAAGQAFKVPKTK